MKLFHPFPLSFCLSLLLLLSAAAARAEYTLLLPDEPIQEADAKNSKKEMDVLLALVEPFSQQALDMEMPQMLAVARIVPLSQEEQLLEKKETGKSSHIRVQREELLGELEEIRYVGKKAWAAHVSLETPGLYQLMTETRPRWDQARGAFEQHFVKTILPVAGLERGWDTPVGLKFEIVPLTRPFGIMAPALFTGKVLLSGDALPGTQVQIARLNTEKHGLPSRWHVLQVVKTNAAGEFSFVCPQPGWWAFMAMSQGDPLKGSDGQPKTLETGAVLWIYVDDAKSTALKVPRPSKK